MPKGRGKGGLQLTPWWLLVLLCVVAGALTFFAVEIWLRGGYAPPIVPFVAFVMPILVGVFVAWQGWNVRRYQMGKRSMNPLTAARIALLAQAGSRTGAILTGIVLAMIAAYKHSGTTAFFDGQIVRLWLAVGGSALLVGCSYLAEWWCLIVDDDDAASDQKPPRGGSAAPA
ncbi:MAG: DUF3180 domain-containing protein [Actinomycetaceae bacterium]|nr:DUF3180 domain-containing protein [Arcanobacterium sp.]MDD7504937.1 DUF3180 domain-containing protein [Actinomycetaceae bacterium]MDY6143283.1 DUF3180 domain-containing protein [Arcanobacterium sp.]